MNRICFRDTNTPDSSSTVRSRNTHSLYIQECLLVLQQGSLQNNNFLVKTFFEIKPSSSKISQVHKEITSIGKKAHQKYTKTDKKTQLSYYRLAVLVSKWKEKSSRASSLQTRMDLDFHWKNRNYYHADEHTSVHRFFQSFGWKCCSLLVQICAATTHFQKQ